MVGRRRGQGQQVVQLPGRWAGFDEGEMFWREPIKTCAVAVLSRSSSAVPPISTGTGGLTEWPGSVAVATLMSFDLTENGDARGHPRTRRHTPRGDNP